MHGHIQQGISGLPPTAGEEVGSSSAGRGADAGTCSGAVPSATGPSSQAAAVIDRSSSHSRGVARLCTILLQLLLVAGGLWMVGCEHCEDRFCKGVQVVTVNMMASASACCENPDGEDCEGIEERFEQFVEGLHAAYNACLDGDLDLLRELLDLIIRVLSRIFLIAVCAQDIDLGDWLDDVCHPYVSSSTLFLASDSITADIGLESTPAFTMNPGLLQPPLAHPAANRIAETGSRHYRFTTDSSLEADAWWGGGRFFVDGQLVLEPALNDASGDRTHQIEALVLELHDESGVFAGRVSFNGRPAPGFVRCSPEGHGMLGASVRIDLGLGAGGESLLGDHAQTVWFELPISLAGRGGSMGGPDGVSAHDVFPVDPAFAQRLDSFPLIGDPRDGDLQGDDSGFMPCQRVGEFTVREWRWLQRMRLCFPQCFAGD